MPYSAYPKVRSQLLFDNLDSEAPAAEARLADGLEFHRYQFEKFVKFGARPVFVSFFAASQPELDFHLVAFFEEFLELMGLNHEIIFLCAGADLDLFHARSFLRKTLFLFFFRSLVAIFVKAHDARNGRCRVRHGFDEVDAFFGPGEGECLLALHYAEILAVFPDYAEFGCRYLIIDADVQSRNGSEYNKLFVSILAKNNTVVKATCAEFRKIKTQYPDGTLGACCAVFLGQSSQFRKVESQEGVGAEWITEER